MAIQTSIISVEDSIEFSKWQIPEVKEGQVVQSEKLSQRGSRGELVDIDKEAIVYTNMTAAQLEEISLQAYEDVRQQAHQTGFDQGREEGYKAGLAAGEKSIAIQLDELKGTIGELMSFLAGQDNEVEQALVNIATCVASSVIRRELILDASHMQTIVGEAVAKLKVNTSNITVFLSDNDKQLLSSAQTLPQEWQLQVDPSLSSGGCRVVTKTSVVDYTLEQQFQQSVNELVDTRYSELAADNKRLRERDEPSSVPSQSPSDPLLPGS